MAEKTYCTSCGHARTSHSKEGCVECPCPVKYMDKDMFAPR
jgi:hypothetical protein